MQNPSPGIRNGQTETADDQIIRPRCTPPFSPRCARSMPKPAASLRSLRRCKSDLGAAFRGRGRADPQGQGPVSSPASASPAISARKIAATFASTGTPAFFVHPAEASHGDLGMITADDVILALSWSGEQPELKNLITYAKRFRIPLIAMTADADSTLGRRPTSR